MGSVKQDQRIVKGFSVENTEFKTLLSDVRTWPFQEAHAVVKRWEKDPSKGCVRFETGYGPSGLPHMGTFGEVVRTAMVQYAFRLLTEDRVPTELIVFSDDMDALRKVPENVPNAERLVSALGLPLTRVPDPFETHPSFGAHNNAELCKFLDSFGFSYRFLSSTECYRTGLFDPMLRRSLEHMDALLKIMVPTLGEERSQTYNPFLPLHPETGRVMQVPILAHDREECSITWEDPETGQRYTTSILGGKAKLQWKPDWAMRWAALGIDYEMAGKDLRPSMVLSGRIATVLGASPPLGFSYELFLDESGHKISKSKGNGLTIDTWLRYAPKESLALLMYTKPKEAKRIGLSIVPRYVDQYYAYCEAYREQTLLERLGNPVFYIHEGAPPESVAFRAYGITYALLLKLASATDAGSSSLLWGFLRRYAPQLSPQSDPELDALVHKALEYNREVLRSERQIVAPTEGERRALLALKEALAKLGACKDAERLQTVVYAIGREHDPSRDPGAGIGTVTQSWFRMLYRLLLGEDTGPRFGSFIALFGVDQTIQLIDNALARQTSVAQSSGVDVANKG